MAIGKNIKKQKLIPDAEEAESEHMLVQNDFPSIKVNKGTFVEAAEFQRRKALKRKFEQEIDALDGQRVHLIVFRLGQIEYAIDIQKTREVVTTPKIIPTPHAPDYIKGIINIRGLVISTLDLALKMGFNSEGENHDLYTLVIESEEYDVGLLIPEVPVTLVVDGEQIKKASSVISDTSLQETYIKGVVDLEGRMIFFIDIDELIKGDQIKEWIEAAEEED